MSSFELEPHKLSRCTGRGVLSPGQDVLECWPHEYDSQTQNDAWNNALDWHDTCVQRGACTKQSCGYSTFTMNYAYDALFDHIPCGTLRKDKKVLLFKATSPEDHAAKMRNFHAAMSYIKHYPSQDNTMLQQTLGVSKGIFIEQVVPSLYSLAHHMQFLDPQLRFWEWNHTELLHSLPLTFCPDGFPIVVEQPRNRFLARLLYSGKYKTSVVKAHLTIAIGPGFPIHYTGPHTGVKHDATIFQNDRLWHSILRPWEYGLGDKAYVGEPSVLTEWKGKHLSFERLRFNKIVQHYRARVEHLISSEVVDSRKALCTRWRGSSSLLAA